MRPDRVIDHLYLLAGVAALVGLGIGLWMLRPGAGSSEPGLIASLWLARPLDLILHLGLMLAGALGIRALLPSEDEEV